MPPTLVLAQAGAQFASLLVFLALVRWYAWPWLNTRSRASALALPLSIHVFRYIALQTYSAQHAGFPISDAGVAAIVEGDVGGAVLAFLALAALQARSRLALALSWLLVGQTFFDTFVNIRDGMREHLIGATSNLSWFILAFFVPAVIVSTLVILAQLVTRWGEALSETPAPARGINSAATLQSGRA